MTTQAATRHWTQLGTALRASREARGLTQEALAGRAGVSRATIQNLEQGRKCSRMPPSLACVARALSWPSGLAFAVLLHGAAVPKDVLGGTGWPGSAAADLEAEQLRLRRDLTEAARSLSAHAAQIAALRERLTVLETTRETETP